MVESLKPDNLTPPEKAASSISESVNQVTEFKEHKDSGDTTKPNNDEDYDQKQYNTMKRKTYSKYDLVKVKVNLEDHFYVFSRFLVSRILTLIKIKEKDAIRITLELKKHLVEQNKLEID